MSPSIKNIPRRQAIPILYTRGTHYDVGYDVVSRTRIIVLFYLVDTSDLLKKKQTNKP